MKRIFAVVMVFVMLFAICAVPAMAETAKTSPGAGNKPTTPDKPVTSPDTSDVFALALGTLALVDGAAITYYIKNRKDK